DAITFSNENEVELNKSITSDASENLHNLDAESNSSILDQSTSHNSGIIVTNSLDKQIKKRKAFTFKVQNEDGIEVKCNHEYKLSTETGNLKSHLYQIHRILLPEKDNNQLTQI
ncbi:19195_t:CDS:2, partial [Racocetra persica]